MAFKIRNNITVICEGDTEVNYLCGLRKIVDSTINIVTTNAKGGGYTKVLKKLKQTSSMGTVARFVLIDFDRYINVQNEKQNFNNLITYCEDENKKGNPTFVVVSNPDFDNFVLNHNKKYKNQNMLSFLKTNYNYKSISDFKSDKNIFDKFNPNKIEFKLISSSYNQKQFIVKNNYSFIASTFTFKNIEIKFDSNNSMYKVSNIIDLFNIL